MIILSHAVSHTVISILNIPSVNTLKLDLINIGRDSRNKRENNLFSDISTTQICTSEDG